MFNLVSSGQLYCWQTPALFKKMADSCKHNWQKQSKARKILLVGIGLVYAGLFTSIGWNAYQYKNKKSIYQEYDKVSKIILKDIIQRVENHQDLTTLINDIEQARRFYYKNCLNPDHDATLLTIDPYTNKTFFVDSQGKNNGFLPAFLKPILKAAAKCNNLPVIQHYVPILYDFLLEDQRQSFHVHPAHQTIIQNGLLDNAYKKNHSDMVKYLVGREICLRDFLTVSEKLRSTRNLGAKFPYGLSYGPSSEIRNQQANKDDTLEQWLDLCNRYSAKASILTNQLSKNYPQEIMIARKYYIKTPPLESGQYAAKKTLIRLVNWYNSQTNRDVKSMIMEISALFGHKKLLEKSLEQEKFKSANQQGFDLNIRYAP